jgi:hypothetical protein
MIVPVAPNPVAILNTTFAIVTSRITITNTADQIAYLTIARTMSLKSPPWSSSMFITELNSFDSASEFFLVPSPLEELIIVDQYCLEAHASPDWVFIGGAPFLTSVEMGEWPYAISSAIWRFPFTWMLVAAHRIPALVFTVKHILCSRTTSRITTPFDSTSISITEFPQLVSLQILRPCSLVNFCAPQPLEARD